MSTFVFVKRDDFRWIEGHDLVARYEPVPPFKYVRCFCSRCGTSLGEILSEEQSFPPTASMAIQACATGFMNSSAPSPPGTRSVMPRRNFRSTLCVPRALSRARRHRRRLPD
jgi:hypothetical protein